MSNNNTKGWFEREDGDGIYYTHKHNSKKEYKYLGTSERGPLPFELYEFIINNPEWCILEDTFNSVAVNYDASDTDEEAEKLPSGVYQWYPSSSYSSDPPERLCPITLRDDSCVRLESFFNVIEKDFQAFLKSEEIYRNIGTMYRRGYLLYGSPGQGKTTYLRELIKNNLPEDSIIIFTDSLPSKSLLKKLKEEDSGRLKIFIFEELCNVIDGAGKLERMLDFLDGEQTIDKTIVFATTNYPERLPGNLVERPSRFDRLIRVEDPSKSERALLLTHYLGRESTEEETLATNKMSVAGIKEAALVSRIRDISVHKATTVLRKYLDVAKKDFAKSNNSIGIGNTSFDPEEDEDY